MDRNSEMFIKALRNGDVDTLRKIPKADLHSHFVLGGDRDFLKKHTGLAVKPLDGPLASMAEMDAWNQTYVGSRFDSAEGRLQLLEAALHQAVKDGVTVLEIGEDVWALNPYYNKDVTQLLNTWQAARQRIAPNIELRLQIGMSRHCSVDYLMRHLEPFWDRPEFVSLDCYGDELAQPIENFIPIYRKAREHGLILKAHVGEWGSAEDVQKAVELLDLDEVQHGIAAAKSPAVMAYLAQRKIRLNLTLSSNVLLGRVPSMKEHPITVLKRSGVEVTINSDDVLIFDSDVSLEYLRARQAGLLSAEELNEIRLTGLQPLKKR